jgi:3-oxoacyl-[acyl-carrier-protein] synthase-3
MSVMSGDGATAWVMGPCREGEGSLEFSAFSETEYHDSLLWVNRPPALGPRAPYAFGPSQNQSQLFFSAVKPLDASRVVARVPYWAEKAGRSALEKTGWTGKDVDLFVSNAATVWYSPIACRLLGIDPSAAEDNTVLYGNMGGTNLPINLYEAWRKGRIKPGTRILFFGHGAGCSFGAATLSWPTD